MSMSRSEPQPPPPVDEPLSLQIIAGEVVFIGPGRVAFSMTKTAAQETCRRLSVLLAENEDNDGNADTAGLFPGG